MPGCCAVNCSNGPHKGFKMYALPTGQRNKERTKIWIRNIGRKFLPEYCKLCEVHFTENQFELHRADGKKKLKWNAVPTIFDNNPSHHKNKKQRLNDSTDSTPQATDSTDSTPQATDSTDSTPQATDSTSEEDSVLGCVSATHDIQVHFTDELGELNPDLVRKWEQSGVPVLFDEAQFEKKGQDEIHVQNDQSTDVIILPHADVIILPHADEGSEEQNNEITSDAMEEDDAEKVLLAEGACSDDLKLPPNVAGMLCRICGKKENSQVSVHSSDHEVDGVSLLEKIKLHLFLEVRLDDGLPQNICFRCHDALNSWHEVFVSCKAADEVLRKCFNNKGKKIENLVVSFDSGKDVDVPPENCTNSGEPKAMETKEESLYEGDPLKIDPTHEPAPSEIGESELPASTEISKSELPAPTEISESELPSDRIYNRYFERPEEFAHRCRYCCARFPDKDELKVHRVDCERLKFLCHLCGKVCPRRKTSLQHQDLHESAVQERAETLKFQCDICGRLFHSEANLQGHKFTHKTHICEICAEICTNRHVLLRHRLIHNILPKWYCEPCCRIYNTAKALRLHKQIDNENGTDSVMDIICDTLSDVGGDVKYSCKGCGSVLDSKLLLVAHVNIPKKTLCKKCKQPFKDERAKLLHESKGGCLPEHLASELNTLQCQYCSKIFQSTFGLRAHENIHLNRRPYKCQICHQSFRTHYQWRSHEDNHGMNIYECEFCGKVFKKHSLMKYHSVKHRNLTFTCNICDKVFKRSSIYYRHRRNVHKVSAKR